jgi:hypothetical protein
MSQADKHLLIKAKGGLGNRILSAIGGLVYAELSDRVPVIDWRDGIYAPRGENAYPLLFDSPVTAQADALEGVESVTPALWRGRLHADPSQVIDEMFPHRHASAFVYRDLCVDLSRADHPESLAVYWSYLPKLPRMRGLMRKSPTYRSMSYGDIYRRHLARSFIPNARIREALDVLLPDPSQPVIGAHVRYTDRRTSIEGVIEDVRRLMEGLPGAAVFLATDNAGVEERIKATFDRVITQPKAFAPDGGQLHSHQATHDMVREAENALIDMWALSRCTRLVYSSHSTFSYTSWLLGDFAPGTALNVDRRNLKVLLKNAVQGYL